MRIDLYNGAALAAAVAASALAAVGFTGNTEVRVEQVAPRAKEIAEVALSDGRRALRDASGVLVPLGPYRRIASASVVADQVLFELCEPERFVAVTQQSKDNAQLGYRHESRAGIGSLAELEAIFALAPDLLFINHFGDPRYAARLRERGIAVFDLGEMHGVATLVSNIRVIGALIGAPERAERLARGFSERLSRVAADVPEAKRPPALFLSAYGTSLYAGAAGSSYHDILHYAGLRNVAAPLYTGWPALSAEQILPLDPEVLVTKQGMAKDVCRTPGLPLLRPCRGLGRIVELDVWLADDPGLPMLDMAEALRERVHGALGAAGANP